jgi:hypothetical protein
VHVHGQFVQTIRGRYCPRSRPVTSAWNGFRRSGNQNLENARVSNGECVGEPAAAVETIDLQNLLPVPDGMELIELADGRKVFAPIGSDPDAVRKHIAERENTRC